MDGMTVQEEQKSGPNFQNILMVIGTPFALMLMMLMTGKDPDQAAAAAAPEQPAIAATASAPAGDLVGELRRLGHTEASATAIAARFATIADPARRRELAVLASRLGTAYRWSDEEAATRIITAAGPSQDALDPLYAPEPAATARR